MLDAAAGHAAGPSEAKTREGLCEAWVRKGAAQCAFKAVAEHEGERVCGVHHRQRLATVECPICLVGVKKRSQSAMACGHIFHAKCIRAWFRQRPLTCPMCRATCLHGMGLLGPRLVPKLQALIRTVPPRPGSFFPAYIVGQLRAPEVAASLGADAELLVDIACECFTRDNFFSKVRAMGL